MRKMERSVSKDNVKENLKPKLQDNSKEDDNILNIHLIVNQGSPSAVGRRKASDNQS